MYYFLNAFVEKSDILHNYVPWGGLEANWKRITLTISFMVKMGQMLESICMEGQGHIFTIDLIFWESKCHAEKSCIQWMVFFIYMVNVL